MSALSARRGFLSGLATLPLIPMGKAVALPEGDDDVLRAADSFVEAERERWAAGMAEDQAFFAYLDAKPPIPAELFRDAVRDWKAGFAGFSGTRLPDGRWWYGSETDLEYLREPRLKQDWSDTHEVEGGVLCAHVPDELGQARADEIIAAHERWRAEKRRLEDEIGYTAAAERADEAGENAREAEEALVLIQAKTLGGIVAKLRAGAARCALGEEAFPDKADASTRSRIAFSIARDLMRLTRAA